MNKEELSEEDLDKRLAFLEKLKELLVKEKMTFDQGQSCLSYLWASSCACVGMTQKDFKTRLNNMLETFVELSEDMRRIKKDKDEERKNNK